MQNAHENLSWLTLFPELNNLDLAAKDLLSKYVRIVEAPIGTIGYREGTPCGAYVMSLEGKSRVYKMSTGGREILL